MGHSAVSAFARVPAGCPSFFCARLETKSLQPPDRRQAVINHPPVAGPYKAVPFPKSLRTDGNARRRPKEVYCGRAKFPKNSFISRTPPTSAVQMLSGVPIRKYSANCSRWNCGKRATDFAAMIKPTVAGECNKRAVNTRNLSSQPMYMPALLICAGVSGGGES
jgi:hypothetical protein